MAGHSPRGQVGAEIQHMPGTKSQALVQGNSCPEWACFSNFHEVSGRLICLGVQEAEKWEETSETSVAKRWSGRWVEPHLGNVE